MNKKLVHKKLIAFIIFSFIHSNSTFANVANEELQVNFSSTEAKIDLESLATDITLISPNNTLLNTSSDTKSYDADMPTAVLDTIIVTASKRSEELLQAPINVTAITSQQLQDSQIESISEISQHTPSMQAFTWGGSRESNIFIRGIGPGLFTDPTVGYYVDGVNYTSGGMFDIDMGNIERVEVLKGPQGTLYGGNSLAGVINVVTKEPSNYAEGTASVEVDSLSEKRLRAYYSMPIIEDELYWNIYAKSTNSDGYLTNVFDGSDYGAKDELGINTKLLWIPSNTLEVSLGLDYEDKDNDSYALGNADFIYANPDKIDNDFHGKDDRKSYGTSLSINKVLDNDLTFTSITGYRKLNSINSADQDAGSNPLYSYVSISDEQNTQLTQEFRLTTDYDTPLNWLVGAYGYKSKYEVAGVNFLDYTLFGYGGPYIDHSNTVKNDSGIALFGQVDYDITPQVTLTGGLRMNRENREADIQTDNQSTGNISVKGDMDFNAWLPKFGISYHKDDDTMWYGSYSQGYRAGGYDYLYPSPNKPTYDKETSSNYEIGYKASFLDNRLNITSALYWIDIEDQQVQQLIPVTNQIVTDNTGNSTSRGLEIEATYQVSNNWLVDGSVSYNDAKYDTYENCDLLGTGASCSGNDMIYAPEFTGSLGVQYTMSINNSLDLFTRVDALFTGDYYYDAQNALEQDAYTLLNAKVGVESDSWDAYVWVKNALDEDYSAVEYNFGAGHTVQMAEPLSVGIGVKAYF